MQRDTKKNYQLYGRNDMIMLDEHNKIYGSLGLAEPYIVATKEGETLLLDGAKDNEPFVGLSIYGKSHQNTVAGNQLLDVVNVAGATSNGVIITNNGDGSFTVTGTPTNTEGIVFNCWLARELVLEEGQYALSSGIGCRIDKKDGTLKYVATSFTFNSETDEFANIYWERDTNNYVDGETIWPMLNAGTTALPWEPYTGGQPSPNPDYPQEIVSVGDDGEIGVNVYGGNFLTDVTDKVISGDVGDSVNDVKATWNVILDKNLLDKELIFSFDSDSNIGKEFVCQTRVVIDNEDNWNAVTVKQIVKGRNYFPLAKAFDEIPEKNITNFYVQLRVYIGLDEAIQFTVSNPMLNIGSTALPFEPYKQLQSLIVSTPDGLPGLPVSSGGNYTDESGQQWISDEIDFKRGKYVKRVIEGIFDGKENWMQDGYTNGEGLSYYFYRIPGTNVSYLEKGICSHARWRLKSGKDEWRRGFYVNAGNKSFEVQTDMTLDEWKSYLSGMAESGNPIKVVLRLDPPIETDLTPEQITAYQSLHTNYPTTTVMNDEGAGMKAIYKQIENGG